MMRIVPRWVSELHKDLEKDIEELAYDYGISEGRVKDSKSIEDALNSLRSNLESFAEHQRPDYHPTMWRTDKEFGWKRKLANSEEKKNRKNFNRRSRKSEKKSVKE